MKKEAIVPIYSYRATDNAGEIIEGSMDAGNEKDLVSRLHKLGYIPIRIKHFEEGKAEINSFMALFNRVSSQDVMYFTQDISTLLNAGLPIDKSLAILVDITENKKFQGIIKDILKDVQGGSYLSDALGKYPDIYSPLYVNMIRAGEAGGVLELILGKLAEFLKNSQELLDYIKSAMVYPLLLFFVGGISMIILLTFVIPRFSVIFADMGQAIPASAALLLGLSAVLRTYWWLIILALGAAFFLWKKYISTPEGRLNFHTTLFKLPMAGKIIKDLEVARFSRTLGTLLKSGVPILEALRLVKDIIGNRFIAGSMDKIYEQVKEGERLSKPLKESNIFPTLAVQMVTVGEETGRLDELLLKIATNYDCVVRNMVQRLISLLEPAMILIMGLAIGFIVISMLMAIFSVNDMPF